MSATGSIVTILDSDDSFKTITESLEGSKRKVFTSLRRDELCAAYVQHHWGTNTNNLTSDKAHNIQKSYGKAMREIDLNVENKTPTLIFGEGNENTSTDKKSFKRVPSDANPVYISSESSINFSSMSREMKSIVSELTSNLKIELDQNQKEEDPPKILFRRKSHFDPLEVCNISSDSKPLSTLQDQEPSTNQFTADDSPLTSNIISEQPSTSRSFQPIASTEIEHSKPTNLKRKSGDDCLSDANPKRVKSDFGVLSSSTIYSKSSNVCERETEDLTGQKSSFRRDSVKPSSSPQHRSQKSSRIHQKDSSKPSSSKDSDKLSHLPRHSNKSSSRRDLVKPSSSPQHHFKESSRNDQKDSSKPSSSKDFSRNNLKNSSKPSSSKDLSKKEGKKLLYRTVLKNALARHSTSSSNDSLQMTPPKTMDNNVSRGVTKLVKEVNLFGPMIAEKHSESSLKKCNNKLNSKKPSSELVHKNVSTSKSKAASTDEIQNGKLKPKSVAATHPTSKQRQSINSTNVTDVIDKQKPNKKRASNMKAESSKSNHMNSEPLTSSSKSAKTQSHELDTSATATIEKKETSVPPTDTKIDCQSQTVDERKAVKVVVSVETLTVDEKEAKVKVGVTVETQTDDEQLDNRQTKVRCDAACQVTSEQRDLCVQTNIQTSQNDASCEATISNPIIEELQRNIIELKHTIAGLNTSRKVVTGILNDYVADCKTNHVMKGPKKSPLKQTISENQTSTVISPIAVTSNLPSTPVGTTESMNVSGSSTTSSPVVVFSVAQNSISSQSSVNQPGSPQILIPTPSVHWTVPLVFNQTQTSITSPQTVPVANTSSPLRSLGNAFSVIPTSTVTTTSTFNPPIITPHMLIPRQPQRISLVIRRNTCTATEPSSKPTGQSTLQMNTYQQQQQSLQKCHPMQPSATHPSHFHNHSGQQFVQKISSSQIQPITNTIPKTTTLGSQQLQYQQCQPSQVLGRARSKTIFMTKQQFQKYNQQKQLSQNTGSTDISVQQSVQQSVPQSVQQAVQKISNATNKKWTVVVKKMPLTLGQSQQLKEQQIKEQQLKQQRQKQLRQEQLLQEQLRQEQLRQEQLRQEQQRKEEERQKQQRQKEERQEQQRKEEERQEEERQKRLKEQTIIDELKRDNERLQNEKICAIIQKQQNRNLAFSKEPDFWCVQCSAAATLICKTCFGFSSCTNFCWEILQKKHLTTCSAPNLIHTSDLGNDKQC